MPVQILKTQQMYANAWPMDFSFSQCEWIKCNFLLEKLTV